MTVTTAFAPRFSATVPVRLFNPRLRDEDGQQYDIAADGSRFLINQKPAESAAESLILLQNWRRESQK
jgi:hypothetical protein